VGLIDRLLTIAPPSLTRFFFANSGSEAVDNAIKIARGHTKRQNIICFEVRCRTNRTHKSTSPAVAHSLSQNFRNIKLINLRPSRPMAVGNC
jgi:4-aminobutyrate aminotransferase-like enzyme